MQLRSGQHNVHSGQSYTILVVDDEPIVHTIVDELLSGSRLPVTLVGTATSGREAVKSAEQLKPDICLLDINLPDMDGLEVARLLVKRLDRRPHIIYLSGLGSFDYAVEAMRLGAEDYILKPVSQPQLRTVLKRVINRIQAERLAMIEEQRIRERVQSVLPSAVPAAAKQTRSEAVVATVKEYVDQHYAERISLATAADHVRLSPGYLGPLFKAIAGISFRSYLRSVRVARAKELMQDPRLNLSEIAQAVGYDDQNYFSQVFLEETGIRPGEYRGSGRHWAK